MAERTVSEWIDSPQIEGGVFWKLQIALRMARAVLKGIATQSLDGATPEEAATDVLKKWNEHD